MTTKKNPDKKTSQQSKKSQSSKSNGVIKGKVKTGRNGNGAVIKREMTPEEIKAEQERKAAEEAKPAETQTITKSDVEILPPLVELVTPNPDPSLLAMQEAGQSLTQPQKSSKPSEEHSETKPKSGKRVLGLLPSDLAKLSREELAKIELKPGSIAQVLNDALEPFDNQAITLDVKKSVATLVATKIAGLKSSTISAQTYRVIQMRVLLGQRTYKPESKSSGTSTPTTAQTTAIVPADQAPTSITSQSTSETPA